ncbi:MAG: universal stress protein [Arthrobacter sp.]|nr:universal stress protein [Arthrobacter sp.]
MHHAYGIPEPMEKSSPSTSKCTRLPAGTKVQGKRQRVGVPMQASAAGQQWSMSDEVPTSLAPVVVGVVPGQYPEVLRTAASLAQGLSALLICAYVDEASYLVEWDPARSAHRLSLHPDADDAEIRAVTHELRSVVAAACDDLGVAWALRTLAGDPARALGRLAAETEAAMIIVGTPERGLGHRLSEALNGSVAAWLSHHQYRPILIVPAPAAKPARSPHRP